MELDCAGCAAGFRGRQKRGASGSLVSGRLARPNQAREAAQGGRSQLVRASVSSQTSPFRREGEAIASPYRVTPRTCNPGAREYDGLDAVHEHQTIEEGATSVTNEPTPDTSADTPTQPSDATSVERNKAVSRRWIEVFNERDDAAEADVRAQDYVAHAPVSLEPTPLDSEAWTRFLSGFVEAFPDLHLTVEDAVGEGDLVAQRVHFAGTHTGEFQGLPPTHRKVTFSGLELNRFVDGRVAEHWFQMDSLTLLQQLGLVVVPGPRLLPRVLAHQVKKLRKKR
jgi:predicted ester cyclase